MESIEKLKEIHKGAYSDEQIRARAQMIHMTMLQTNLFGRHARKRIVMIVMLRMLSLFHLLKEFTCVD